MRVVVDVIDANAKKMNQMVTKTTTTTTTTITTTMKSLLDKLKKTSVRNGIYRQH